MKIAAAPSGEPARLITHGRARQATAGRGIPPPVSGAIMIIGGLVEIAFGINAEGKPLDSIAEPLTKVDTLRGPAAGSATSPDLLSAISMAAAGSAARYMGSMAFSAGTTTATGQRG